MENVNQMIELLHRKNKLREAKYAKLQREQEQEYESMMKTLSSLKEDRNHLKDTMVKDLRKLTNVQHTIDKLLQDSNNESETVHGLPISHEFHKEAVSLLTDGINFINNFKHSLEIIGNSNDNGCTPETIVEKLTLCADSVGNEVNRTKSQIYQTETLNENIDVLQEQDQPKNIL